MGWLGKQQAALLPPASCTTEPVKKTRSQAAASFCMPQCRAKWEHKAGGNPWTKAGFEG